MKIIFLSFLILKNGMILKLILNLKGFLKKKRIKKDFHNGILNMTIFDPIAQSILRAIFFALCFLNTN